MKKIIQIILFIIIFTLSIILGWYLGKEFSNKEDKISNTINTNNQKSNQIKNKESNQTNSNTNNSSEYNNYLGYWYESKEHLKDYNLSSLNIKKVTDKQLILDLYISRIANFDNIKVNLTDLSFEATSDNALSNNDEIAKITGILIIFDNEVIIKINESNLKDFNNNEISFKYQTKELSINSYKGTWYESKEHLKNQNPSSINIKNINNNKLTFDLYISRLANFDDVKINITEEEFQATSDNAITKDNNKAKVSGFIRLINGEVIVLIKDSNIVDIEPNTSYIFTYKDK